MVYHTVYHITGISHLCYIPCDITCPNTMVYHMVHHMTGISHHCDIPCDITCIYIMWYHMVYHMTGISHHCDIPCDITCSYTMIYIICLTAISQPCTCYITCDISFLSCPYHMVYHTRVNPYTMVYTQGVIYHFLSGIYHIPTFQMAHAQFGGAETWDTGMWPRN